jgi:hypothetical protein
MSFVSSNDEGGFVIFSGTKLWYSSKEAPIKAQKNTSVGKVRASAKTKRIVEFPIFDKINEMETDPYWKSLFDEAATGKFPRNFKFQNNTMNYKIRSKNTELKILDSTTEDLEDSVVLLKKFFLDTAGIVSPEDLRRRKKEEEKRISEMIQNEVVSWNQIRSEKQRMIMISLYVENLGKEYKLTIEERKGLVQNIRIGILGGYFNSDNIHVVGNQIETIVGLEYNETLKEFEINKTICKPPKISRKMFMDDITETCGDSFDKDSMEKDSSLHSSQSLKKRWNKFLSDISRK